METVEELVDFLRGALDGGARRRVVDTGEAWSIMRREGVVPPGAPDFRVHWMPISRNMALLCWMPDWR